jgi:hypothetical protein
MSTTDVEKARVWLQEVDVNQALESGATRLRQIVRERPLVSMAVGFILGMFIARRGGR